MSYVSSTSCSSIESDSESDSESDEEPLKSNTGDYFCVKSWYYPNKKHIVEPEIQQQDLTFREEQINSKCIRENCGCCAKIEDFDICNLCSESSHGIVFRVVEKSTGNIFALKALEKTHKKFQNLKNEIEVAERLNGLSSVVDLYHVFETKEFVYLMMEWLVCDLYRINEQITIETYQIEYFLVGIINALIEIHKKNVILVDMKLSNVMLNSDGDIKMVDFGLCAIDDDKNLNKKFRGTNAYIAPENARGEFLAVGDSFSLGIMILKMAGIPLNVIGGYDHLDLSNIKIWKKNEEDIQNLIDISKLKDVEHLNSFVNKLLMAKPESRIKAEDMIEDEFVQNAYNKNHKAEFKSKLRGIIGDKMHGSVNENFDEEAKFEGDMFPWREQQNIDQDEKDELIDQFKNEWISAVNGSNVNDNLGEHGYPTVFKDAMNTSCRCNCKYRMEQYELNEAIRTSSSYVVFSASRSGEKFAVKAYFKTPQNVRKVLNESNILLRLKNDAIATLFCAFETSRCLFVVAELCSMTISEMRFGGALYEIPSIKIESIALMITMALRYLEGGEVIHTNLGSHNVMFTEAGYLKLTGFGRSIDLVGNTSHVRERASIFFSPPELLKGYATAKSPQWNLGLVLAGMVCQKKCPKNESSDRFVSYIKSAAFANHLSMINLDSRFGDYIQGLLSADTFERMGYFNTENYAEYLETVKERIENTTSPLDQIEEKGRGYLLNY
ncbi:hypothetical protein MHBO_000358 [Bonamia ostreae]|uniref:Protein kinase domain-containing protein n=1 Tax=Bonamia ostreae TaxID=126728 RepID=A0ABV2AFE9_9EUKA